MSIPTGNAAPPTRPGLAWPVALAFTTIVGTLITACMMPFVALAVMAATTMRPGRAAATMVAIWFGNQLLGFTLMGYPPTSYALAWGAALAAASLAAMAVARAITPGTNDLVATRLGAAFGAGFIVFEALLFGFAVVVGGLDTFTPGIVAQIAINETIWLVSLIGLHLALTRSAPRWFGTAPGLRFA